MKLHAFRGVANMAWIHAQFGSDQSIGAFKCQLPPRRGDSGQKQDGFRSFHKRHPRPSAGFGHEVSVCIVHGNILIVCVYLMNSRSGQSSASALQTAGKLAY